MKYFRLLDDVMFQNRWYLSAIHDVDNWLLSRPPMLAIDDPLRDRLLRVGLQQSGEALDFSFAGYADVPVVSFKTLQAISGLDGFTAFPAKIDGLQQKTSYHILHFWDEADCVDENKSCFGIIPENDPIRPDLAGNYRAVTKLTIDTGRTLGKHIFRPERLSGRVIISEEVKRRFEAAGVTGAVFESVNGD